LWGLLLGLALVAPAGWLLGGWTWLAMGAQYGQHEPAVAVVEDTQVRHWSGNWEHGAGSDVTVVLRVVGQDHTQTFDPLPPGVSPQTVDGRLPVTVWHGHIIDVNGERAETGWKHGGRAGLALVLYPMLLVGSMLLLTRVVPAGGGPAVLAVVAGGVLTYGLLLYAVSADSGVPWWPLVPLPAALLVALVGAARRTRSARARRSG
jgi:hypothetical protein